MKKIISLLVTLCFVLLLCACGDKDNESLKEASVSEIVSSSGSETSGMKEDTGESITSGSQKDTDNNKASAAQSAVHPNSSENSGYQTESDSSNVKIVKTYNIKLPSCEGEFRYESFYDSLSLKSMPYRLHIPKNHSSQKKYPVILFLHGAGEIGSDNERQLPNFVQGFGAAGDILENSIIVCPQTPSGWGMDEYEEYDRKGYLGVSKRILDYVIKQYGGDRNRIYLTGLSLGSFAVWRMLDNYPGFFAAAVPVCGGAGYYASQAMVDTPIWIYHGTNDSTVPYSSSAETYNAIRAAGGNRVRFTELPGVDHNAWDYAYTDREMFSWMFSQNLQSRQSTDYDYINAFEVVTEDNKRIIADKDFHFGFYIIEYDTEHIELNLTDEACKSLNDEYAKNKNCIFRLKFLGKNIYDFKLTSVIENNILRIEKTVDDEDFDTIRRILKVY